MRLQGLPDGGHLHDVRQVALDGAVIDTGNGSLISGPALEDLALKYVVARNVMERLSNWMDVEALRKLADGLTLDLDDARRGRGADVGIDQELDDDDRGHEQRQGGADHMLALALAEEGPKVAEGRAGTRWRGEPGHALKISARPVPA